MTETSPSRSSAPPNGGVSWLGQEGARSLSNRRPAAGMCWSRPTALRRKFRRRSRNRSAAARSSLGRMMQRSDQWTFAESAGEIQTEIVLHIERLGDRRFPGAGWVGNRGKKLRIEAFSIRPLDTLLARDIEFKALGPNRRQTPWVTDAKLCGTRGTELPLTGFAVRLAPHVASGSTSSTRAPFSRAASSGRTAMASSASRRSPTTRWRRSMCA